MPPPPVTPSPYRFVIKKKAPVQKTPPPPSNTPQFNTTPHPPPTPRPPSSTPQFNATPRFHFSSTPKPTATQTTSYAAPTPSAPRFLTPARKVDKEQDAVEIEFSSSDVQQSVEISQQQDCDEEEEYVDQEDDYANEEPISKRRRLSSSPPQDDQNPDDEIHSSLPPILSFPQAPSRHFVPNSASRFLAPVLPPSSIPSATNPPTNLSTFRKPPPFRPPDPAESQTRSDPLPEQFSPAAKGRKYIPEGLASELQGWLFGLSSTIQAEGQYLVKVSVDEVSGSENSGVTMIKGLQVHITDEDEEMVDLLGEVRVVLAGEGRGEGLQKGKPVEKGVMIGIKGPVWEINLGGNGKWGVGVDWKVL